MASGSIAPRVELEDMGLAATFTVRRTNFATHSLFKEACKKPAIKVVSYLILLLF